MLYLRIRFYLILIFAFVGVVLHIEIGLKGAWYLYASSLILLLTHYLFGNVWPAFARLRKGKIDEAEQLIQGIKKPQWLARQHRAYYHFTKGMVHLQRKSMDEGKLHLEKSLEIGLRSGNDNALAALNMAHILFVQKNLEQSRTYLRKAQSYESDDLMIKENIKKLDDVLAKS